jgi:hypothetical protein
METVGTLNEYLTIRYTKKIDVILKVEQKDDKTLYHVATFHRIKRKVEHCEHFRACDDVSLTIRSRINFDPFDIEGMNYPRFIDLVHIKDIEADLYLEFGWHWQVYDINSSLHASIDKSYKISEYQRFSYDTFYGCDAAIVTTNQLPDEVELIVRETNVVVMYTAPSEYKDIAYIYVSPSWLK